MENKNLKLLFYIDNDYQVFHFDNRYKYEFNKENLTLEMKKNDKFIKDFYGNGIDLSLIAGKNGSGKTYVLNSIYNLHKQNGIYVFEDKEGLKFLGNKEVKMRSKEYTKNSILEEGVIYIDFLSEKKDIKLIAESEINMTRLFFSNSLEGKNKILENLNKIKNTDLSLVGKIYNKKYSEILNESIIKQISMILDCEKKKVDFPSNFFELPTKITGKIFYVEKLYRINDPILSDFIFTGEEYSNFLNFCNSSYLDRNKSIQEVSLQNNVSLFNSLLTYGLKIKDIFKIIEGSENNVWDFFVNCLGRKEKYHYDSLLFNEINKEINKLIEIEQNSEQGIQQINLGMKKTEELKIDQLNTVFEYRNHFGEELKKIRPELEKLGEEEFEEIIDSISILEILIFLWRYLVLKMILDNLPEEMEYTENIIQFETSLKKDSILIELLSLNNSNFPLELHWAKISSGENYLLNLFSEIHNYFEYHRSSLTNKNDILLCIDEVDLGLHPEWQRKWIKYSPEIIKSLIDKTGTKEIQIIMSTHSPIMLSDCLSNSVHLVKNKEKIHMKTNTFGNNIHDLMSDSFFLEDGVVGEFAKDKINSYFSKLKANISSEEIRIVSHEVGEQLIRNKLLLMLHSLERKKEMHEVDIEIENLKKFIKELKEVMEEEVIEGEL